VRSGALAIGRGQCGVVTRAGGCIRGGRARGRCGPSGVGKSSGCTAQLPDEAPRELLGEVLQERTDRSLEHVFRVLSLSLPPTSLAAAYRGVRSTDPQVRGVALAYLADVLPAGIRQGLWTVLDAQPGGAPYPPISAADQVEGVLLDNQSIALRVDELLQGRQTGSRPK
jgi:hypothetical protein